MSTAQHHAYRRIRKAILNGIFPPGTQLRQEQLADQFDMSRTSVRYALQALANDGFVEIGDTRRSFVADVSPTHAEQMYDILAMLEGYSAGLAATQATDEDVAELRALIDEMASEMDDDLAYLDTNSRFHRKVHEMSGNRTLRDLIERLVDFPQTLYLKLGTSTESVAANEEHRRLVDAIQRRDRSLAELEMRLHIETRRREARLLWDRS